MVSDIRAVATNTITKSVLILVVVEYGLGPSKFEGSVYQQVIAFRSIDDLPDLTKNCTSVSGCKITKLYQYVKERLC